MKKEIYMDYCINLKMTNVLVTGGFGFIGSHTIDLLISKGYSVKVIDNLEKQVHQGIPPVYSKDKIEFLNESITRTSSWKKALSDSNYIINLAALTGSSQSFWKLDEYNLVNTMGISHLFNELTKRRELTKNIKKIITASSSYVYGEGAYFCEEHGLFYPDIRKVSQLRERRWDILCPKCSEIAAPVGVKEDKPPQVPNPYALSKYFSEQLTKQYSDYLGIPAVSFRYFNVYGPGQSLMNPYTGVLSIFYSRLASGNTPYIFEDGEMTRDFIHVSDVAQYNLKALEKGEGIFNVGTGRPTKINTLLEILSEEMGVNITPRITNESRVGDIRNIFSDNTELFSVYGSNKFKDLKAGVSDFVNWAKETNFVDRFERAESVRKKFSPSM